MGSTDFKVISTGATAKEAFIKAVDQANYDHGHNGYSGTIAEKNRFVMIDLPPGQDPVNYAHELINAKDPRIDDTWGAAGCIKTGERHFLFFGWASS